MDKLVVTWNKVVDIVWDTLKNLWFRDTRDSHMQINDVAVRIRAGMLLAIPLYMGLTLFDVLYGSRWLVDGNTAVDTYDTNWDDQIIYSVEATRRVYDYSLQTWVLLYALFEMVAGMFVFTARFSPTILLSSLLAHHTTPVWKPLLPKRFAWTIGSMFIIACLLFFNPDTFAYWLNDLLHHELLPTDYNYMPNWIPLYFIWICLGLMWMEAMLGFCLGCKVHSLLVAVGLIKGECYACNDIDWEVIRAKNRSKVKANMQVDD